jgi:hypothetical protein
MVLLILASLLGLFGPGLLGSSKVGDQTGALWLEYDRLSRRQSEATGLKIHLGAGAVSEKTMSLSINQDFLDAVSVKEVVPSPESTSVAPGRVVYTFRATELNQPVTIAFRLEPEKIGTAHGQIGLLGGPTLSFDQFIYP